ncbi:membrane protein [Sulfurifustis variabilis]|uniref:Membrane protein n=1 Tax=Sulfurifustis variabilis TaxID=1675686 RepID=A0A1B4V3X4_9GAMM|nr:DUF4845 domain-containing protein [Sulfurifustis variabilis]BAU48228.1 membrane protein [Sulfurifustis variabilis]
MRAGQKGMTLWGTSFVLAVLGIAVFLILKLFPVYMQDFKVDKALQGVVDEPGAGAMTKPEVVEALYKRFIVDDIEHVKPEQHLTVEQNGKNKIYRLEYEAVVPLFHNVSALIEFQHMQEVRAD